MWWRCSRIAVTWACASSSVFADSALHVDRAEAAVARDRVLDCGQRGDRDVVLVGRAVGSLGLRDADDLERRAADPHRLADRVLAAEQVLNDGRAEHHDPLVALDVGAREHRALGDLLVTGLGVGRRRSDERARRIGDGARDQRRPGGADDRRRALDVGGVEAVGDRRRVLCREVDAAGATAEQERAGAAGAVLGLDDQDVRSQVRRFRPGPGRGSRCRPRRAR